MLQKEELLGSQINRFDSEDGLESYMKIDKTTGEHW